MCVTLINSRGVKVDPVSDGTCKAQPTVSMFPDSDNKVEDKMIFIRTRSRSRIRSNIQTTGKLDSPPGVKAEAVVNSKRGRSRTKVMGQTVLRRINCASLSSDDDQGCFRNIASEESCEGGKITSAAIHVDHLRTGAEG